MRFNRLLTVGPVFLSLALFVSGCAFARNLVTNPGTTQVLVQAELAQNPASRAAFTKAYNDLNTALSSNLLSVQGLQQILAIVPIKALQGTAAAATEADVVAIATALRDGLKYALGL